MVQVSEWCTFVFFSTLLWEWWSFESTEQCQRYVGVSLLNLLHACVGLLHQYMWTSFVWVEVSYFPPSYPLFPFNHSTVSPSVPRWCCRSCSWDPSWHLLWRDSSAGAHWSLPLCPRIGLQALCRSPPRWHLGRGETPNHYHPLQPACR